MTHTMARARARTRRRMVSWPEAVLVAAGLVMAVVVGDRLHDPERASFAVRNDTRWDIDVAVQIDGSSLPLTTIGHERAKELTEVLKPGGTWTFVWRFDGEDVGRSTVDDRDLHGAGFELRVPDDVEVALRTSGAAPSP